MCIDYRQIIGPHDTGIAKYIEDNLVPLSWDTAVVQSSTRCLNMVDEIRSAYFTQIAKLSLQG